MLIILAFIKKKILSDKCQDREDQTSILRKCKISKELSSVLYGESLSVSLFGAQRRAWALRQYSFHHETAASMLMFKETQFITFNHFPIEGKKTLTAILTLSCLCHCVVLLDGHTAVNPALIQRHHIFSNWHVSQFWWVRLGKEIHGVHLPCSEICADLTIWNTPVHILLHPEASKHRLILSSEVVILWEMKTISSSMLTIQTGISRWKPVSRASAVLIFFMQTTSKLSLVELYKDLQLQKFWLIHKASCLHSKCIR